MTTLVLRGPETQAGVQATMPERRPVPVPVPAVPEEEPMQLGGSHLDFEERQS